MQGTPGVTVLRLGHRPGRDERITTHVGLTARALGADRVILAGAASSRRSSVEAVTERFGGPFDVETTEEPEQVIERWDGAVVHLTMYGLPIQDEMAGLHAGIGDDGQILVVVGAEKVPFGIYERADWNIAVTNQPHSEIAALAVFLDRLFEGAELDRDWIDADRDVVPRATGKRVEER